MVKVVAVACSDSDTSLELFSAARANTGASSFSRGNASNAEVPSGTFRVRARPLDDIVAENEVSRVDTIKIDVEGAGVACT